MITKHFLVKCAVLGVILSCAVPATASALTVRVTADYERVNEGRPDGEGDCAAPCYVQLSSTVEGASGNVTVEWDFESEFSGPEHFRPDTQGPTAAHIYDVGSQTPVARARDEAGTVAYGGISFQVIDGGDRPAPISISTPASAGRQTVIQVNTTKPNARLLWQNGTVLVDTEAVACPGGSPPGKCFRILEAPNGRIGLRAEAWTANVNEADVAEGSVDYVSSGPFGEWQAALAAKRLGPVACQLSGWLGFIASQRYDYTGRLVVQYKPRRSRRWRKLTNRNMALVGRGSYVVPRTSQVTTKRVYLNGRKLKKLRTQRARFRVIAIQRFTANGRQLFAARTTKRFNARSCRIR